MAILGMSGERKDERCEELENFESQLGLLGLVELMKCSSDFTTARNDAIEFCVPVVSLAQSCLSSAPTVFEDQHDGERNLVALSDNRVTMTLYDKSVMTWVLFSFRYPLDQLLSRVVVVYFRDWRSDFLLQLLLCVHMFKNLLLAVVSQQSAVRALP